MTKLRSLMIVLLAAATPLSALSNENIRIRTEYRGEEAPTYMIFAFTLHVLKEQSAKDRDAAIKAIHARMKLGSEPSAETFLQRMLDTGIELEVKGRQMEMSILCPPNPNWSKKSIYRAMDTIDDARKRQAEFAFEDFADSLDELETGPFLAWMEEEKKGYTHRSLDHESMYESSGMDVKVAVDGYCEALEYEQLNGRKK